MSSNERDNQLLGELREFKRATLIELIEIKRSCTSLHAFRYKVIGMAMLGSFLVTTATAIAFEWFRN